MRLGTPTERRTNDDAENDGDPALGLLVGRGDRHGGRGSALAVSKKSKAERQRAKQARQVLVEYSRQQLAAMGPFRLSRLPRTALEREELRRAAMKKAQMEGLTGEQRRRRADAIVDEAVKEVQQRVRTVRPHETLVRPPGEQGLARSPTGLLILPGPDTGMIVRP